MPGSSTIVVRLIGDASSLRRDLNSATTGLEKFRKRAQLAAVGLAAAAAVVGKKAVDIASDTTEALSKAQTVFGTSSASVTKFASTSATQYGISQRAALAYASAMGSVQIAQGKSQSAAAKSSLVYTQLSADLASFNNTSIDDAAQALTASLTGEYEMLKKYGIVINDSRLATEAQRLGMEKSGATWTAQQKALLSYNLIMHDTALAQGDFARTSEGLANQGRILSAQLDDLQGKIGEKLLPWMIALAKISIAAIDFTNGHASAIRELANWVQLLGAAFIAGYAAVKVFAAWQAIGAFATGGWAAAFWGLNAAMAANPVGIVVVAVAALVAGVVVAYKKFDAVRYAINWAMKQGGKAVLTFADLWLLAWKGIFALLGKIPGKLGAPFRHMSGEVDKARGKLDELKGELDSLPTSKRMDIIINIRKQVQEFNEAPFANGAGFMGGGTGGSIALNKAGTSAMQEYFDQKNKAAVKGANDVLSGLGSGIGGGGGGGGGSKAAKEKPVKEAKKTGQEILDAFLGGLQSRFPGVAQKLSDWSDTIPTKLGHGLDKIVAKTEAAMAKVTAAQEANTAAMEKAQQVLDDVRGASSSFATSVRDSVKALGDLGSHGGETFEVIAERLQQSLTNARLYAATMERLKASGLSDAALQSLINSGPGNATTTGQAILAAGRAGIEQINSLTSQIGAVAESTATKLADQFYGQGIRTAQGVIDGLKSKDAALKKQMTDLGDALVAAVKKGLDLKVTGAGLTVSGKRALGGPVTAGRSYLVGERGKELFTPSSSGRITANDQLGGSFVIELHGKDGLSLEGLVEKVVVRRDRATVAGVRAGASRRF